MTILVTGAAGFIGYHLAARLLAEGRLVTGVDNLNTYYDPRLKRARLKRLAAHPGFEFLELDLAERAATEALFTRDRYAAVVHLAAQAGVRHSLENPHAYIDANVTGFLHVLEGCRRSRTERLIYASSSSVYAGNLKTPFAVGDPVETPVSLYAATKRAGELMAHCYTHLFGLATTGLRFFTVYGPWGRPDQAPMIFTRAIVEGRPIDVFNSGRMRRDFTYVDDIVEGVVRVLACPPAADGDRAPYAVYNIGHHEAVELDRFIATLERLLGRTALRRELPMQPGDVPATFASIDRLAALTGFAPRTTLDEGLARFVAWYRGYYGDGQAKAGC